MGTYGVTKIDLNNQEAKVKTCASYSDDYNCDAVVPVHSNSQEHEEHTKLEAQDARNVAVGPRISPFYSDYRHSDGIHVRAHSQGSAAVLKLRNRSAWALWVGRAELTSPNGFTFWSGMAESR